MEANFFKSLEMVLKHEGGFVDHPDDPGGATNKGITHKTYSDFLGRPLEDVDELKNIPDEHVQLIYKQGYWDKVKGDNLPSGLDFAIFDWAVNSGPGRAAKALQKAVGATADGAIGPKTLEAVEAADAAKTIKAVADEREAFYKSLRTFNTFGKGWLRRNKETRDFALEMV
jgi:lysozyme family protein